MTELKLNSTLFKILLILVGVMHFDVSLASTATGSMNMSVSFEAKGQAPKYRFKPIDNPDLDRIGGLWAIVQDHQGFIWFGGADGLARYDGNNVKVFTYKTGDPSSLSSNYVQSLLVDQQGRLWVGTQWGLNLYDPDTESFTRYLGSAIGRNFGQAEVEGYIPVAIPGKVEAEVVSAYRESTLFNQGDVGCGDSSLDVEKNTDDGVYGCVLGWTAAGEWTEYIIRVADSGIYNVNLRAATALDAIAVHLVIDGAKVNYPIKIQKDSWQSYHDHVITLNLDKGLHTIKLVFETGDANINYLNFTKASKGASLTQSRTSYSLPVIEEVSSSESARYVLSENNIESLVEDETGALWVATERGGVNRFSSDGRDAKYYFYQPQKKGGINENKVLALAKSRQGGVWLGTVSRGLNRYDPHRDMFISYVHDDADPQSLINNEILSLYEDSRGDLWVGTKGGLDKLDVETGGFIHYGEGSVLSRTLPLNNIYQIVEDNNGNIWMGDDGGGIAVFHHITQTFTRYIAGTKDRNGLLNNKVRSVFKDANGGLWLGHFPGGVSKLSLYASAFHSYQNNIYDDNSLSNSDILSLDENKKGNFWVGTEGGLNYLDRMNNRVTRYVHDPAYPASLPADPVTAVLEDSRGTVWVGMWQGGLSRLDPSTSVFTHHGDKPDSPFNEGYDARYNVRNASKIYEDKKGQVWVGAERRVMLFDQETETLTFHKKTETSRDLDAIYDITGDHLGNLWVGGLNGVQRFHPEQGMVGSYRPEAKKAGGLGGGDIKSIFEDSNGRMWLASSGGGVNLYDRKTDSFKVYRHEDGLVDNNVVCIEQDLSGFMWFGTAGGLSRFDPKTEKFRTFTDEYGLPSNLYKRAACTKTTLGELVFGTSEGLVIFDPKNIPENKMPPPVMITNLRIFNESVQHGAPGSPLIRAITQTKQLTLDYKQSVFSFEFSALNYVLSEKNQYAYKMEGLEKEWNYVGTRRSATYTSLNPGHYIFRVKAANNEGIWNEEGTTIAIRILPPWWLTWWAYSVYVLMFCGLFGVVIYTRWQKSRAEYELQVNKKLRELDKVKDSFLANTSHELRTPLNGIIGLSESMLDGFENELPAAVRDNLVMISKSGKRLAHLVNDILDFSKLKENTISLNMHPIDIHSLTESVLTLSSALIGSKPITVVNAIDKYAPSVIADENRLQQILYNLIGNGIKFTHQGSITISASHVEDFLWVAVSDTGIGIAEAQLDKIFDAFEQVDSTDSRSYGGTGLGLAVTRQLVELHGGELKVESHLGEGSTFRFSLPIATDSLLLSPLLSPYKYAAEPATIHPITNAHPITNRQGISESSPLIHTSSAAPDETPVEKDEQTTGAIETTKTAETYSSQQLAKAHVLIVDDEQVNRQVAKSFLAIKNYRISECENGQQALDLIRSSYETEDRIDLVLLDVMMPVMSGYETCKKLRQEQAFHELPILFLTAKTQIDDLAKGYEVGGNDFLTKPVDKKELYARVEMQLSLLSVNRQLQENLALLKQTQSQLVHSEKMSSLITLVTGLAHEINNPINMTQAGAYNLDKQLKEFQSFLVELAGEENDEAIQIFKEKFDSFSSTLSAVTEGSTRIMDLVQGFKVFSHLDEQDYKTVCLSEGLNACVNIVKARYLDNVDFELDIQDDPEILCQAAHLNQVFMNVLVNACQAIGDAHGKAKGKVCISLYRQDSELIVKTTDNGCGMSQDILEKLFEPFFTTREVGKGTGLGMAISYGIIERHKGRIEVTSELGVGTTIAVYLPLGV